MTVYLVGAGPGDPGLLTVRGAEVLGRADVVVYDRLSVAPCSPGPPARGAVRWASTGPRRHVAGRHQRAARRARQGRREVVRLKGGDPFVFARGGEEAPALLDAGVPFEVVPGITSAIAVPAYAGIPVTLRHSSTSFTVVTGHEDPRRRAGQRRLGRGGRVGGTIVVLMGVARIGQIAERLIAGGRSPDTPVAAVTWGTRPEQRTVRATLATLADQPLAPPATIVIGEVAALDLAWFENRPLFGRRVVVTRPASRRRAPWPPRGARRRGDRAARHRDRGSRRRRRRPGASADGIHGYDWLVLTSANGARRFLADLRDARDLGGVEVAAIGPGTAEALLRGNVRADLVPDRFVAEALLDAFPAAPADRQGRVLLARAAVARDVLPDGLRARGWTVDVVDAYKTVAARRREDSSTPLPRPT